MPYAAQVEAGNVILKNAEWNRDFTDEHFNFPNSSFKDQVDAAAGAFNKLNTKSKQYAAISSFTTRNEIIKE